MCNIWYIVCQAQFMVMNHNYTRRLFESYYGRYQCRLSGEDMLWSSNLDYFNCFMLHIYYKMLHL